MSLIIQQDAPKLRALRAALKDKRSVNKVMSFSVSVLIKKHFRGVSATQKNKFGRPSSFWKRMIESVRTAFSEALSAVEMARPVAQRRFGGTIKPTGGKQYLTIPIAAIAYNRTAADLALDIGPLEFYESRKGNKFLVSTNEKFNVLVGEEGVTKNVEFLYLLKERVTQKADPSVMPTDGQILGVMAKSVLDYIRLRIK